MQWLDPPLLYSESFGSLSLDDGFQKLHRCSNLAINDIIIILDYFSYFTPGINQAPADCLLAVSPSPGQPPLQLTP
jgi:hypothetical protein